MAKQRSWIAPMLAARTLALALAASTGVSDAALAADPLGRYPADPAQVSVAGISSGAFMANQLHIAHSAGLVGAGMVAGGLYGWGAPPPASGGGFPVAPPAR